MPKKQKQKAKTVSATGFKILFNSILCLLFIASIIIIGVTMAYFQKKPETVKTAYGGPLTYAQTDEQGDKPYPIEVNVFTNERNNGTPCYEVRLNYYTDTNIPESEEDYKNVYSSGYQSLSPIEAYAQSYTDYFSYSKTWTEFRNTHYYYNSVFGESYKAINELDYSDKWIFDYGDGQGLMLVSSLGETLYNQFLWAKAYVQIGINDFIADIFEIVSLMDEGIYILPFDVSEYFNYKIYNTTDKQFVDEKADNKWLFFQMKVTKSSNGLISSSQSLFGQVANNPNYRFDNVENTDYYRSLTLYTLTQDDFIFEMKKITLYDVQNTLFIATLKQSAYEYLSDFSQMYINVVINIDNHYQLGYMMGLDENSFRGLNVADVVITSNLESGQIPFLNFTNIDVKTGSSVIALLKI